MGSNFNNSEGRQSNEEVVSDSEALYRQTKMQKIRPKQESPCLDEMIPSISNHRCEPNSRLTSPSSLRKKVGNHGQDRQSSPRMKAVEVAAALVSITTNNNFEFFQDSKQNANTSLEPRDQLNSFPTGNPAAINDLGRKCVSPDVSRNLQQGDDTDTSCKYDNTFAPMIIDTGGDIGIGGCAIAYECDNKSSSTQFSTPQSSINDLTTKPFSPDRVPQRSAMKGSEGIQVLSPILERRDLIQPYREKYEIQLPGRTNSIERQRTIAFNDNVDIQCIEHVLLLSSGGPQSLWYQENEYETIKFKTLALLDRVDHSSGIVDGKKYCTRGLEKFMSPEATEVKKHQAWDSVLNEQFLQRKDGEFDEETLANIYMYSTKRSRLEANKRASLDAEASEAYLKTTFRKFSSFHTRDEQTQFDRRVSL